MLLPVVVLMLGVEQALTPAQIAEDGARTYSIVLATILGVSVSAAILRAIRNTHRIAGE